MCECVFVFERSEEVIFKLAKSTNLKVSALIATLTYELALMYSCVCECYGEQVDVRSYVV